MTATTELFHVQYRPSIDRPPVNLLCQSLDVDGEKLIWLDGINLESPVLAPISAMRSISWVGSFKEFASRHLDEARKVFEESQGEHTPCILARAMLYMRADSSLSAADAIEVATEQAVDLIDADCCSAFLFSSSNAERAAAAA